MPGPKLDIRLLLATVSLALRYKIKIGFSFCGKGWVKLENKDLAKMLSKDTLNDVLFNRDLLTHIP